MKTINNYLQAVSQNSFYGISYDTIFTTSITIFIFILGYLINRWVEHRKEIKSLEDLKELIKVQINTILEKIDKQNEAFIQLSEAILSKKYQDYIYAEANYQTESVTNLSNVDLFKSFLIGSKINRVDKIKSYNVFTKSIAILSVQNQITRTQFMDFIKSHRSYIDSWNASVNALMRYHDFCISFAKRNNIPPSNDPFLKEFSNIVGAWSKNEKRTEIKYVTEQLLKPLRAHCLQNPSDERTITILPLILEAEQAFRNREHILDITGKYFTDQVEQLKKIKTDLESVLISMSNKAG